MKIQPDQAITPCPSGRGQTVFGRGCQGGAVALLALALTTGGTIIAEESRLGDTRTTLEKWVEARQEISKNKAAWQNDKETIQSTIALFESELESLEKLMTTVRTNSQSVLKEFDERTAEKAALVSASEQLQSLTAGLERQILELTNSLPPTVAGQNRPGTAQHSRLHERNQDPRSGADG